MESPGRSVLRCSSCGAPIDWSIPDRCGYCGSGLSRPAGIDPVPVMPPSPTAYNWHRYLYWYLAIPIFGLVVSAIALTGSRLTARPVAIRAATSPRPAVTPPREFVDALMNVLPQGHDVLITIRIDTNPGASEWRLARFDAKKSAMLWRGEPLGKERLRPERVAVAGDAIYLADESRLVAMRLRDGVVIWRSSLTTELAVDCESCLTVVGNRLLALQKDGSLQAFETDSGRLAWGIRLKDTPRKLTVAGGRVLVYQKFQFDLLDPADGRVVLSVEPRCRSLRRFPDERPDGRSPRLLTADGKVMYIQFGNFRHCTQRWDLAAGKMVWGINLADAPGKLALLNATSLFLDATNAVRVLDVTTGALRTLVADDDYNLRTESAGDDVVAISAVATWDSSRKDLIVWGLEPATGKRLWQYTAQKAPRAWSHKEWWTVHAIGQNVTVTQFLDGDRLALDALDAKTGVNAGRKILGIKGTSWSAFWQDGLGWVDAGSNLYAIDLAEGRIAYHVP